jgi:hypothetical protein
MKVETTRPELPRFTSIIGEDRFLKLPPWGVVAFLSRCAHRVRPIFEECANPWQRQRYSIAVEQTCDVLAVGQSYGAIADPCGSQREVYSLPSITGLPDDPECLTPTDAAFAALNVIFAAINAAGYVYLNPSRAGDPPEIRKYAHAMHNVRFAMSQLRVFPFLYQLIYDDLAFLERLGKEHQWDDQSYISPSIFCLHSIFDLSTPAGASDISIVSGDINARLMFYLRENPRLLFSLSHRDFEEGVAELFNGFGFDVQLTSRTRDGGYDVIAVTHRHFKQKYLIECKHYAGNKRIGVVPVRMLHGVVEDEAATKGLLVTTAEGFTTPANDFIERHKWQLEGCAFEGLVQWLKQYQECRNRVALEPSKLFRSPKA